MCSRKWDVSEVDAMLSRGNVPSDWEAFLDDRNMRARMVEALSGVFFERFHDSPFMKKVERMIVVNGRCGFDMARGEGPRYRCCVFIRHLVCTKTAWRAQGPNCG